MYKWVKLLSFYIKDRHYTLPYRIFFLRKNVQMCIQSQNGMKKLQEHMLEVKWSKAKYTCARESHRCQDSARHRRPNRDQLHSDEKAREGRVLAADATDRETASASLLGVSTGHDMQPHAPAHTYVATSAPSRTHCFSPSTFTKYWQQALDKCSRTSLCK